MARYVPDRERDRNWTSEFSRGRSSQVWSKKNVAFTEERNGTKWPNKIMAIYMWWDAICRFIYIYNAAVWYTSRRQNLPSYQSLNHSLKEIRHWIRNNGLYNAWWISVLILPWRFSSNLQMRLNNVTCSSQDDGILRGKYRSIIVTASKLDCYPPFTTHPFLRFSVCAIWHERKHNGIQTHKIES